MLNVWVKTVFVCEKEGGWRGGHQGRSAKGGLKANIKRHNSSLMHVGVTPTQHGTTQTHQKRLPKPPSWRSSQWAIGRLWNTPTSHIDSSCCLVYNFSLSRRDGQRLQIAFGRHGVLLTKLELQRHQFVMGVLLPCVRVSPDCFSDRKHTHKKIAFSHTGISAFTMVRYQYCFPILLAARGG